MRQPIPLATATYQSRSLPLSAQRLVNLYPELSQEGSKAPFALFGTPGLKLWSTFGAGAIKGLWNMGGTLYAVAGTDLFSVDLNGSSTNIGSMIVPERVSMADNGTQLMIACGVNGYIYTVSGGLVRITDTDYPGGDQVDFIDGFFIVSRDGSGEFNKSAAYDGTSWDALDYATAEGDPDDIVAQLVDHREIWLFGKRTTEVWYNEGVNTFPFSRLDNAFIERGCAARFSVAKMVNTVFWLGEDLVIYLANAYNPERVSTHAIEASIKQYDRTDDAWAYAYTDEGHKFYILTFPSAGHTWAYDMATQKWHEREAYIGERSRVNSYDYSFSKHIVGDYQHGKLYVMDLDTYTDNGEPIQRIGTSAVIHNLEKRSFMTMLQIVFESGKGLVSGQGVTPQAMLQWSDDGGQTWSNGHWRGMGAIGEYTYRTIWRRLGNFRSRIFRFIVSDPIKVVVISAHGE